MRRFLFIIICLTCFSCTSQAKQDKNTGVANELVLQQLDSLKNKDNSILVKFDSLNTIVNNINSENKSLKSALDEKENKLSQKDYILYFIIFPWLIIISILIYKYEQKINKISTLSRNYNKLRKEFEFILSKYKEKQSQVQSKNSNITTSSTVKLECRLNELEGKINSLLKENKLQSSSINIQKEKVKNSREAYFGMVKGEGFFNDVYSVNKDESLFKITFLDSDKVSFVPLELNKIRFIDGIEKAVHYTGEKSLKEATSFIVKSEGYAVRKDDVWEIKDKVEIILK